jgi:hypothetical protein
VIGHDDAEHGVAEELEPLVRLPPGVLGAPRTVDDGRREVLGVGDGLPQSSVEVGEALGVGQDELQPSLATT